MNVNELFGAHNTQDSLIRSKQFLPFKNNINQQVAEIPHYSSDSAAAAVKLQRGAVLIASTSHPDALIRCRVIG